MLTSKTSQNDGPGQGLANRIILSTLHLRRLNEKKDPEGTASGCLVRYRGLLILLTVEHATRRGPVAIELQSDVEGKKTQLYRTLPFNYISIGEVGTDKTTVADFCHVNIEDEIRPMHQEIDAETREMRVSTPKIILDTEFADLPNGSEEYGFFGQTHAKRKDGKLYICPKLEMGMKYLALL